MVNIRLIFNHSKSDVPVTVMISITVRYLWFSSRQFLHFSGMYIHVFMYICIYTKQPWIYDLESSAQQVTLPKIHTSASDSSHAHRLFNPLFYNLMRIIINI